MDVTTLVAQVVALDTVKNASSWTFDSFLHLAFEVAVIVKKAGSSKVENISLLVNVLDGVIEELKKKEISSVDQATATAVEQRWNLLKETVDLTVPVVFSHVPHLDVVKSWWKKHSCCSGSAVEAVVVPVVASPPQ
jgi:hypothetical protein